jgi:hypothetical protein
VISHEKEKEDRIVNNKSTNLHGITRLLNVTLINSHHSNSFAFMFYTISITDKKQLKIPKG